MATETKFQPFFGKRKELLSSMWVEYMERRDDEGGRESAEAYANHFIIPIFLKTFPWFLPDDFEPTPGAEYSESNLDMATFVTKIPRIQALVDKILIWLDYNWGRHRITHRIMNFEGAYGVRFCEHDHAAPCRPWCGRRAVEVAESVNPPAHVPHIRDDTNY